MRKHEEVPKEKLLLVALDAAARSLLPEARVTNCRYRDDRMVYAFDVEKGQGKVGVIELSRQQADDLLDRLIELVKG